MKSITQYIKGWIKSIQESDNQKYIDKINQLHNLIIDYEQKLKEKNSEVDELQEELDEITKEYNELKSTIKKDEEIKKPVWLKKGVIYNPKRRIVGRNFDEIVEFKNPSEVYDKSVVLYNLLKSKGFLDMPKNYRTARKLLSLFNKYIKYTKDKTENWRPPTDTIISRKGDCEDYSLVISSALGMLGWKEDEVFLAMGEYHPQPNKDKWFGHAWAVAKINGEWWVLEGTNPNSSPERWRIVKGHYRANWGLINWKFNGHILEKEKGLYYLDKE